MITLKQVKGNKKIVKIVKSKDFTIKNTVR